MTTDLALYLPGGIPAGALSRLVCDSVSSPHSQRCYQRAIRDYVAWASKVGAGFCRADVQSYRAFMEAGGKKSSTINQALSALRKLASEAAENGFLDPAIAGGIERLPGVARRGQRTGNWLTEEEFLEILLAPDQSTVRGLRDYLILGLLAGCGLRREELATLETRQVVERDGRLVIADIAGKGERVRTAVLPRSFEQPMRRWLEMIGGRGSLIRSVRAELIGESGITPTAIYLIVTEQAQRILGRHVAPHDMRRTCAGLLRRADATLEEIAAVLGHASTKTTELYLRTVTDVRNPVVDRLGI